MVEPPRELGELADQHRTLVAEVITRTMFVAIRAVIDAPSSLRRSAER